MALVVILFQVLCAFHVVRTGRPLYWIFIIVIAPLLGCLIYVLVEMLPEWTRGRAAAQVKAGFVTAIDPHRELRELTDRLDTADTADNRRALAEALLQRGQHEEAIRLYRGAMVGLLQEDPALMQGLARAQFAAGEFANALQTLNRLRVAHPRLQSAEADLLHARCLEGEGKRDQALAEYARLVDYYPGPEAKCRYALLLQGAGRREQARPILQEVVTSAKRSGPVFMRAQREWVELARRNLSS
jgi:hypothetical protein